MKFSENWLREWIDPGVSTEELVAQLTMAGLEVDAVEPHVDRVGVAAEAPLGFEERDLDAVLPLGEQRVRAAESGDTAADDGDFH